MARDQIRFQLAVVIIRRLGAGGEWTLKDLLSPSGSPEEEPKSFTNEALKHKQWWRGLMERLISGKLVGKRGTNPLLYFAEDASGLREIARDAMDENSDHIALKKLMWPSEYSTSSTSGGNEVGEEYEEEEEEEEEVPVKEPTIREGVFDAVNALGTALEQITVLSGGVVKLLERVLSMERRLSSSVEKLDTIITNQEAYLELMTEANNRIDKVVDSLHSEDRQRLVSIAGCLADIRARNNSLAGQVSSQQNREERTLAVLEGLLGTLNRKEEDTSG
jgi:hypothetical protein